MPDRPHRMGEQHDIVITVTKAGRQPLTLLLGDELVVGRDCEGLVVPDSEVSRRHLRFRRAGAAVEVTDLESTNGSLLDGKRLTGSQVITGTGRLVIGDTGLTVEVRPTSPSDTSRFGASTEVRVDDLRSTSLDLLADAVSSRPVDPMAQRRSGETTTIVFSDIESSTERAAELGDTAWFELLEGHNDLFRTTLATWGGDEIKSLGDGFMLTFPSVSRALGFTVDVQRAVERDDGLDLRVRMGAHTGEAIADSTGDLFGRHVNLAARVANLAAGGQILASLVVREIAMGQEDFRFGELFLAELKGFADPQPVYELLWREPDR